MFKNILTKEQKDYLIGHFGNTPLKEIAKSLGLEENVVAMESRALNLKKRSFKKFSEEEVELINEHYKYLTCSELSQLLNRNRSVIFNKLKELGLDKNEEDVEKYQNAIKGLEDSIMYMHTNFKYSNEDIQKILSKNGFNVEIKMINTFIEFNKKFYKEKWSLFNKSLVM